MLKNWLFNCILMVFLVTQPLNAQNACETDECKLQKRLANTNARLEKLVPKIEKVLFKNTELRKELQSSANKLKLIRSDLDALQLAIKSGMNQFAVSIVNGPCEAVETNWNSLKLFEIKLRTSQTKKVRKELERFIGHFPGLNIDIGFEPVKKCGIALSGGISVSLTRAGPRRSSRGRLAAADVSQLPSERRCSEIGQSLVEADQPELLNKNRGLLGFWIRLDEGGVALCAQLNSGEWSRRSYLRDNQLGLVIKEEK